MKPDKPMRLQETELRAAIVDFAAGSDAEMVDEISSLTKEQLRSSLLEEGIDIEPRLDDFHSRISAILGPARLASARQKLNEQSQNTSAGTNWAQTAKDTLSADPSVLRREIESHRASGYGQSSVFFRGYEEATTEDLQQIVSDLRELRQRAEEDAE